MGDESIWKKEVSFNRKAEGEPAAEQSPAESEPDADTKESLWKREVNAEPAAEPEAERPVRAERGPGEGDSGEPGGSPAPEHPVEPEEAPKETLWKRELSFAPTAEESVVEEPVAEGQEGREAREGREGRVGRAEGSVLEEGPVTRRQEARQSAEDRGARAARCGCRRRTHGRDSRRTEGSLLEEGPLVRRQEGPQ